MTRTKFAKKHPRDLRGRDRGSQLALMESFEDNQFLEKLDSWFVDYNPEKRQYRKYDCTLILLANAVDIHPDRLQSLAKTLYKKTIIEA